MLSRKRCADVRFVVFLICIWNQNVNQYLLFTANSCKIKNDDWALQQITKDNFVKVSELGSSSIDLRLVCHTDPIGFADFCDLKERLIFTIIEAVESNGSEFAFPTQSIYLENQSQRNFLKDQNQVAMMTGIEIQTIKISKGKPSFQ